MRARWSMTTVHKLLVHMYPSGWSPYSRTRIRVSIGTTHVWVSGWIWVKTHLFHIHLCWSASVCFCMYHSGGVCVCECVCECVCVSECVCVCVCVCASWMFQSDYLDTCCFECLILYFWICTCSVQLSMFHMERCSRNTLIIIIVIIIVIIIKDGTVALRKVHTHSTVSLSSLPKVALKTVPIFVWLNTDCGGMLATSSALWTSSHVPRKITPYCPPMSRFLSVVLLDNFNQLKV